MIKLKNFKIDKDLDSNKTYLNLKNYIDLYVEQSFYKQNNALNPTSEWVPRENQGSDFLGSIEYKLGCFFRKLQPEEEHRGKSISHFNRVLSLVPPDYIMA